MDCTPPDSSVLGILQARTLEWVAISFSNAWKWKVKVKSFSCVWLLVTPRTAAYKAPPSMGFSRQEYWSGLPLPSSSLLANSLILEQCFSKSFFRAVHIHRPRILLYNMGSDSVSLGWSLRFYFADVFQGILMLLAHGPHLEQPGIKG